MSITDNDFALTDGERHHPLWVKLAARFEIMLRDARGKNDDAAMTHAETAALRGKINCLKSIIALGDEPPRDG